MVCHADMDMDDREAMRRYNVMATDRGHKSVGGNARVCYAFVLVHQGEAWSTACRCASRRVFAEETETQSRRRAGRGEGAGPRSDGRVRSGARAVAAEDREASSVGGIGATESAEHWAEPCWWPAAAKCGGAAKSNGTAATRERGANNNTEEKTA
ncbi:hypothetical protein Syun_007279 [Stephania yunnanensis]|uniref:Uncharacterized protein n=1 Tax=Stephania yunnanensis TaxID=152371 RepID=A0AAP0KZP2_9MAGN